MKTFLISIFLASVAAFCYGKGKFTTRVVVTTYNATKKQCGKNPNITADGTRIRNKDVKSGKQRIVAISRDLLWAIPLGSTIWVEGYGKFEVRDTMNARFKHRIDILQHPSKKNFKRKNIKITLIKKPKKKKKRSKKR